MIGETRKMAAIRERGENFAARTPSASKAKAAAVIAYPQFNLKQNVRFVATHPEYAGWRGRVISLQLTDDGFVYGVKLDSGVLTTRECHLEADGGSPVPPPAPRPDFTDPTVPLATGPGGYTLEMEAADKRRGLRNTRQLIIGAVIDADIWQSAAAEHLWAALATVDAECVAAGLPTSLTETGALR